MVGVRLFTWLQIVIIFPYEYEHIPMNMTIFVYSLK